MLLGVNMLFLTMFFMGLYSFFLKSHHLLTMLLSLEFLSLVIFMSMFCSVWGSMEKYVLVFFLTFCVCEGAFGLSLLVSLARSTGSDYLQGLMFLKC